MPSSTPKHSISDVDDDARTGVCAVCGPGARVRRGGRGGWVCGERDRQRYQERMARDPEGERARRRAYADAHKDETRNGQLGRKYKLTPQAYDALVAAQGGKCPICHEDLPPGRSGYVDHDHDTGVTRGILHLTCNMGLGYFADDADRLRSAADYLDRCPKGIVGVIEIAERLGYPARTVHQWGFRGVLPPPDYASVNGSQAWNWVTILRWAGDTDRARLPEIAAAHARLVPTEILAATLAAP